MHIIDENTCDYEWKNALSFHPQTLCPVPEETIRVARAAYPKGNVYELSSEARGIH